MSKTVDIGRVGMLYKGEWDSDTTYERLDVVSHDGSSYIVTAAVVGMEPPNDSFYAEIARVGDTGETGNGIESLEQTSISTESSGANVLTIVLTDGTELNFIVRNGEKGDTGNGIESLEQTVSSEESSGENVWTATMTDGTVSTFTVLNGEQGEQGNLMWPEFDILEDSGELTMYVPDDYNGPEFSLNDDGELEVTYDNG